MYRNIKKIMPLDETKFIANPEKMFRNVKMPDNCLVAIFSRQMIELCYDLEHICDCEYCTRQIEETVRKYFKTQEDLDLFKSQYNLLNEKQEVVWCGLAVEQNLDPMRIVV